MPIVFKEDHGPRRALEYPDVGDQLDAIWKALATLPRESLPTETSAMLDRVQAVKARFPKPGDSN
ncbi:hypothetical protein BKK79_01015 [Cupriavidus sp. USMAA2-4]|uniref:hypothetical protein n=1 Tax=Cupriavidus sp. USMAA2-4 TaxID=876364 RepID=UPI0008A6FBD9|nr:hypothetical protein [Cupriavidus sp. USMAA2-4]AOY90566.1 hypothetical protein BKK79_01015 [Cupriavidus sp. USMAA2-4]